MQTKSATGTSHYPKMLITLESIGLTKISGLVCMFILLCANCSSFSASRSKEKTTALVGARIIDGKGSVIEQGALLLQGDIIYAVGKAEDIEIPKRTKIINLEGKTILPALISAHAHLGLTKDDTVSAENVTEENINHQLKKYARFGVGTVASLGTDHNSIYRIRDAKDEKLPFLLTAGRGFGVEKGAPPIAMGMTEVYRPENPQDAEKFMAELAENKPDFVKIWVDDFGDKKVKKLDQDIYKTLINKAHENNLKVVAHVYYLQDAKRLAQDGVDIFGHSIRDKKLDPDTVDLMKQNNIAYIPTLALDDAFYIYSQRPNWMKEPFFKEALDSGVYEWLLGPHYKPKASSPKDLSVAKQNVLILHKAGIKVGMGTDSGATLSRIQGFAEHRELELLVEAGLTPHEALIAATGTNAEILGISSARGALKQGFRADLLILDADPLEDIRNTRKINSVWLNGKQLLE